MRFGPWLRHGFKLLARLRFVRGTPLDVFGYTQERRIERALIDEYIAIVDELLVTLDAPRLPLAVRIASVPETIRGYGHVKLGNLATARAQWRDLLERWRGSGVGSDAGAPRKIIPLHVE